LRLDLNCDLGEGEPPARTAALMRCLTSANVACGGHAGDVETLRRCAQLARRFGVRFGAHPGPCDRAAFGRNPGALTASALRLLLVQQVAAAEKIAAGFNVPLHHIKLHGALYHATEAEAELARCYVHAVQEWWPRAVIYALVGGRVERTARRAGAKVWGEAFADRAYQANGRLVPRSESGAVVHDPRRVLARVKHLASTGEIVAVTGQTLRLQPRTVCVHSDTPQAVSLVRKIAAVLGASAASDP
jgi:UPF0271 protein